MKVLLPLGYPAGLVGGIINSKGTFVILTGSHYPDAYDTYGYPDITATPMLTVFINEPSRPFPQTRSTQILDPFHR